MRSRGSSPILFEGHGWGHRVLLLLLLLLFSLCSVWGQDVDAPSVTNEYKQYENVSMNTHTHKTKKQFSVPLTFFLVFCTQTYNHTHTHTHTQSVITVVIARTGMRVAVGAAGDDVEIAAAGAVVG